jgi:UDP-2,3-diacylglucosamine hydrolase
VAATTVPALPAPGDLPAPAEWSQIDFISDLHLAPDMPLTVQAWEAYLLATPADAVFILGDLFDVWVGDDARRHGFEAKCADVLTRAAKRTRISFMAGNRDFLIGAEMLGACGVSALPDPTLLLAFGRRVLLSHGDALCFADTEYQRYRAQVRSPQWQATVLALPLDERRRLASQMRHASEQRSANTMLPAEAADIDAAAAAAWMRDASATVLVHGHTHQPGSGPFAVGCMRHVLSDWDLDHADERPRAEVLRLTRSGFARLSPTQAVQTAPTP